MFRCLSLESTPPPLPHPLCRGSCGREGEEGEGGKKERMFENLAK